MTDLECLWQKFHQTHITLNSNALLCHIIHIINWNCIFFRCISTSTYTVSSILLIDTPGFQNPATCGRQIGASFEDLCHNYFQERLQLLFHHTNLVAPKDRYLQENIDFSYDENENENLINPTPIVNLLDKTAQNTMIRTSQNDLHEGGFLCLYTEFQFPNIYLYNI